LKAYVLNDCRIATNVLYVRSTSTVSLTNIRPAEPADAMAVAQVHVRGWQHGYRGLLPDDYLDGLQAKQRAERYRFDSANPAHPSTIVAIDDVIRGFATTAPARDADVTGFGELCALYVDPDRWGQGIGRALLSAARDRMRAAGFRQAILWVLVGNARATRFYEADGWRPDGLRRTEKIWGIVADDVRYRRGL
jgi:GNAT superfamily N-acetyltransferase